MAGVEEAELADAGEASEGEDSRMGVGGETGLAGGLSIGGSRSRAGGAELGGGAEEEEEEEVASRRPGVEGTEEAGGGGGRSIRERRGAFPSKVPTAAAGFEGACSRDVGLPGIAAQGSQGLRGRGTQAGGGHGGLGQCHIPRTGGR